MWFEGAGAEYRGASGLRKLSIRYESSRAAALGPEQAIGNNAVQPPFTCYPLPDSSKRDV